MCLWAYKAQIRRAFAVFINGGKDEEKRRSTVTTPEERACKFSRISNLQRKWGHSASASHRGKNRPVDPPVPPAWGVADPDIRSNHGRLISDGRFRLNHGMLVLPSRIRLASTFGILLHGFGWKWSRGPRMSLFLRPADTPSSDIAPRRRILSRSFFKRAIDCGALPAL